MFLRTHSTGCQVDEHKALRLRWKAQLGRQESMSEVWSHPACFRLEYAWHSIQLLNGVALRVGFDLFLLPQKINLPAVLVASCVLNGWATRFGALSALPHFHFHVLAESVKHITASQICSTRQLVGAFTYSAARSSLPAVVATQGNFRSHMEQQVTNLCRTSSSQMLPLNLLL